MDTEKKPIFRELTADDPDPEATEIESLCMNCGENGTTRLLLTRIPFYKEVVLMSFECEHCGYRNNEIQSGAKVEDKGIKIVLHVTRREDLNREVIKSDFTSIKIPEVDFEIPAQSQKGEITTVEGVLDRAVSNLEQGQEERKKTDMESAVLIDTFLEKLKSLYLSAKYTMIFEDISGNCFVENPYAPLKDTATEISQFVRTIEQDHALGIFTREEIEETTDSSRTVPKSEAEGVLRPICDGEFTLEDLESEVMQIPTNCPECGSPCETNMKVTKIPHFKEVIIMATVCESCGHRTNEVKSGGGIEPKGIRIEVKITSKDDLCRDVLKSETCTVIVPELDLEVGSYALSGRFTTAEGLFVAVKEQLAEQGGMFRDSKDDDSKQKLEVFLKELDKVLACERSVTLILDDPAGNSYIASLLDQEPDSALKILPYERTFEHNEVLGLNDMKTENYEEH